MKSCQIDNKFSKASGIFNEIYGDQTFAKLFQRWNIVQFEMLHRIFTDNLHNFAKSIENQV